MTARIGDLAGRGPLGPKRAIQPQLRDTGKRPDYLAAVRQLPCCICTAWGFPQTTPTHAHHTICGRFGQRKTPDVQAIPLCWNHHQGPDGIHTRRAWWVDQFGPDVDWIAGTQDQLAHLLR